MAGTAYRVALVLAVMAAGPVSAQEARPGDVAAIRTCYADATGDDGGSCIGFVSEACRAESEGGETTLGIVDCAARETAAWDVLLNEEYRATRDWARASDAAEAEYAPEFAVMADALLAAQRAWIAFRDAECGLAYARWGAGSLRHVAAANCTMAMTAERTLALRAMREEGG